MLQLTRRYLRQIDGIFLALCAACSVLSVVTLVSIGHNQLGSINKASVQFIASALGILLALIVSTVDYRALARAWPLHAVLAWGMVLPTLLLHNVRLGFLTVGYDAGGTSNYSWYRVGGMTFQPAAGAHGEFTGVLLIKQYHDVRGDHQRTKIIVPDSAHGTNPATAAMCGYQVVNIPSGADGCVDLDALRAAVGPDTAGLMLTNPNTVGIFDKNILEITKIVHDAGGLCYYDGANLNAVMGVVRPGDMGFDCIHSNLHKTFATPHGGGGPGAGAVGCKGFLRKYMPGPLVVEKDGRLAFDYPEKSIGRVKLFYGNFDVCIKALTYVLTLGRTGIPEAAMNAVLNANYMRVKLAEKFTMAYDEICMHEFVMSLVDLHKETGVSALDLAKGMLDYGLHPPTMYFPLIVHEALMVEPCETESKETMDEVCDIYGRLFDLAYSDPDALHTAPHDTPVRRLDEVGAARNMILRYSFAQ